MATDRETTKGPHTWTPPGFRRRSIWRAVVAVAGYLLIALMTLFTVGKPFATLFFLAAALGFVALVTNYCGTKERLVARFAGKHPQMGVLFAACLLLFVGSWSC